MGANIIQCKRTTKTRTLKSSEAHSRPRKMRLTKSSMSDYTTKTNPVNDKGELPQATKDYLNQGAPNGSRNEALFRHSAQLRDAGYNLAEVQSIAGARGKADGLETSEVENTIRSVFNGEQREPIATKQHGAFFSPQRNTSEIPRLKIKRFEYTPSAEPVEVPTSHLSMSDFLKVAFKPGEWICINTTAEKRDGKWSPSSSGTFAPLEWWLERIADPLKKDFFVRPQGAWIRLNPFKDDAGDGSDHEISDYRHLLIESDHLPKEQQWEIYKKSGLPITSVTDSGGSSLHAWVRVDATSHEQYKERAAMVYETLVPLGFDAGNKNPSRMSRLPGAVRDGVVQQLCATNIGAASFEEWEKTQVDDGLPETRDLSDILVAKIEEPKHVLKNFVRHGQVFTISGGSKTFKSWTLEELALCVSSGVNFLKWETYATNVFFVDTELEIFDLQKRTRLMAKAKNITLDRGEIEVLSLRGVITTIDILAESLIRRLNGKDVGLIIIDSLYSLIGNREENSNEDMREVFGILHRLAKETGSTVAVSMHHGKGDQSTKRALDRIIGGGASGRSLDVALDILQHGSEKGAYNFEPTLRTFEGDSKFVARRENNVWVVDSNIKPDSGKGGSDAELFSMLDLLRNELEGCAKPGEWQTLVESEMGIKKTAFNNRKAKLEQRGLIDVQNKG
jgi:RecA-family ATPase